MASDSIIAMRVHGLVDDPEDLRPVLAGLHFAGFCEDLRIGLRGEKWVWRTPLMNAGQLETFLLATERKIVAVTRSRSNASHANAMTVTADA